MASHAVSSRSRWGMRAAAVGYVGAIVVLPLVVICWRVIDQGGAAFWDAISSAQAVRAFELTGIVTASAVAVNTVFGVSIAVLLARYRFPGKRLVSALIDLSISVSPIVVGLALVLVYGPYNGWFGKPLHAAGVDVIYAVPGMILATAFVSLPLVVREVVPVLEDEGIDQEQAAQMLGASAPQRFWRITLPTIKWALAYGVVLSIARAIGEFGAIKVVSGDISGTGQTQTATLLVDERVEQLEPGSYQVSLLLIVIAVIAIVAVSLIRPKESAS